MFFFSFIFRVYDIPSDSLFNLIIIESLYLIYKQSILEEEGVSLILFLSHLHQIIIMTVALETLFKFVKSFTLRDI